MKIGYVDPDHAAGTDFRGNPKDAQILLTGTDGTRDNYRLGFTRQTGPFYSPRHAHNFEQIRIVLGGGPMNYGPDCWIQPGEIAYFPEGTPYGPQDYDTTRYGFTFQFGGASLLIVPGDLGFFIQAHIHIALRRLHRQDVVLELQNGSDHMVESAMGDQLGRADQ